MPWSVCRARLVISLATEMRFSLRRKGKRRPPRKDVRCAGWAPRVTAPRRPGLAEDPGRGRHKKLLGEDALRASFFQRLPSDSATNPELASRLGDVQDKQKAECPPLLTWVQSAVALERRCRLWVRRRTQRLKASAGTTSTRHRLVLEAVVESMAAGLAGAGRRSPGVVVVAPTTSAIVDAVPKS
jgi:hypothetical protein